MDNLNILEQYAHFVDAVTSDASKNNEVFIARLQELSDQGIDIARLTTAGMGLAGEAGETVDLVKKVLFHGKAYTDEIKEKLILESGDVSWYWMNLCIAIGVNPIDVLIKNIEKLQTRYPGGKFSVERSENRIV
ncbi:MAG: nucleoside triphosphate pyrophosphohydrolase family protein [Richelia sp. RM2_1_2]|nr:nucleoside triphosphate pyrophosphohydrolase family protein [Richelia sp. RM2_1_2]